MLATEINIPWQYNIHLYFYEWLNGITTQGTLNVEKNITLKDINNDENLDVTDELESVIPTSWTINYIQQGTLPGIGDGGVF